AWVCISAWKCQTGRPTTSRISPRGLRSSIEEGRLWGEGGESNGTFDRRLPTRGRSLTCDHPLPDRTARAQRLGANDEGLDKCNTASWGDGLAATAVIARPCSPTWRRPS